jgi:flavin-dependent dehydrogenase
MTLKPIIIVGGGLAGLTLGIALRQRRVPVQIFEAGHYPRHRVCGEFINGRGQTVLHELGLKRLLVAARGVPATTAAFFCGQARSPARRLPSPAICVSRHELDNLLAREFQRLGGTLFEERRYSGDLSALGVVRATGRRLKPNPDEPRWFGLKVHATGLSLEADLEMHLVPHGYVGICRLGRNEVNICGIFQKQAGENSAAGKELLRGAKGGSLGNRIVSAELLDETFCAVAGIDLRPDSDAATAELRIGDALTMIPPVTGNGMSIAFECASLATGPLVAYSGGTIKWEEAHSRFTALCHQTFDRRLAWAHRLQTAIMHATEYPAVSEMALRSERLWRFFYSRTR